MNLLEASTGIKGLDDVVNKLRIGDNVVWQVDDLASYKYLSKSFVENALKEKHRVVYLRFASHEPVLKDTTGIKTYVLDAESGFESFSKQVHEIATKEGEGVYYVFDCLSDLLSAWASDLMIGNFFLITCPYLFELNTIAYFAIFRNKHSYRTIARIRETTQLLLDVYNIKSKLYIHPLKVWNRYSPTMFLPHLQQKDRFIPITNSFDAAKLFSSAAHTRFEDAERALDYWDRLFLDTEQYKGMKDSKEKRIATDMLSKILVGKDQKMLGFAKQFISLEDLLEIKSRLIGTGMIGGKAVGMLLSRKILIQDSSFDWKAELEPHDSFYIGADVFYAYIVQNGWWRTFMEQKTKEGYFDAAKELREKMLSGKFPMEIKEQFQQMLEYFGQSPVIVRSSSLLEDGFGNVFAGKYESIFCVNQGSPEQRYKNFEEAVRQVFASTMSEEALSYRLERGLDRHDEQMAILVQRVSGSYKGPFFFPDLAGVGISFNTYVWEKSLDPKAGMIRLVFGLGTRAVNRVEDDYPRIVSLDQPRLTPHSGSDEVSRFSQHKVDLLDIGLNKLETSDLERVLPHTPETVLNMIAKKDPKDATLTFDKLFSETDFTQKMRTIMKTLESSYEHPVDIEFTANFSGDSFKINLLQCRPLQKKGLQDTVTLPETKGKDSVLLMSEGNFMGGNISQKIRYVIYIDPERYSLLNQQDKYETARITGKINAFLKDKKDSPAMLMGPGRWGTSTPSMGVPVSFFEINHMRCVVEIAFKSGNLIPELSFGTHMFQDLVESNIFYIAVFPEEEESSYLNIKVLNEKENLLEKILPQHNRLKDVIKVLDFKDREITILSDIVSQKVICVFG
ncbi:MAG: PEP/pyruvate-binding domain-containing protein [Candidatus Margulisiibacteriota bacterium]